MKKTEDLWKIEREGVHPEQITQDGNRFLIGNGYMGVRGTLEEYGKAQFVAVNLAGLYDLAGNGWREPLNVPNPFFTVLSVDKKAYFLPEMAEDIEEHQMQLDFRNGILHRRTVWNCEGKKVVMEIERFVSAYDPHLLCMRCRICPESDVQIAVRTGIDGDVWEMNGPHYDEQTVSQKDGRICVTAVTHEKQDHIWVTEDCAADFPCETAVLQEQSGIFRMLRFHAKAGDTYEITKAATVYTSCDRDWEERNILPEASAYDRHREKHCNTWQLHWKNSEVRIDGDDDAMRALNYSLYHLHSIAPRHADNLSIPARGLSGQMYKGAVFWDTEMFMLPFFLYTEPKVARALLKYRIDTLDGARKKAKQYGYDGAFYAWESQEGGYDACSDYNVTDVFTGRPMRTYFKDRQVHISAAVVYGLVKYLAISADYSILEEGGLETILECAVFYYSLLLLRTDSKQYEIHDVIGPDEYHERVNNNGYTNRMAQFTLRTAAQLIEKKWIVTEELWEKLDKKYGLARMAEKFSDAADRILIPQPDSATGIIEQFDGYHKLENVSVETVRSRLLDSREYWGGAYGVASHTQVIKQADVVTWLALFPSDFPKKVMEENWKYYEKRTEHGSSLSACMYALLACQIGKSQAAYPYFMRSASADLCGKGKEWAGLVYIGGTHPAAAGGAYINAIEGFGGLRIVDGNVELHPQFPQSWKALHFRIYVRGKLYEVYETAHEAVVTALEE